MVGAPAESKLATLLVEDESEILDLQVNNWGLAKVLETAHGTDIPIFSVDVFGRASIEGRSTIGLFTVDGVVDFTSTSAPSTVDKFEVSAQQVQNATGTVTIKTGADVTALTSPLTRSRIGALNILVDGTFTLQQRPQPPTTGNARKLIVKSLFIEKDPTEPMGILDLKDNAMIVDYSGDSPVEDIRQYITYAYDTGPGATHWIRDGINSSIAAAIAANTNEPHKTGLGYGEATDLFTSFPASFEGQSIDSSTVLVKYTFYGDANLSGNVNLADFNRLAANFGQSPRRWSQGDFNYDQLVNLADFNRLAGNFGQGGLAPGERMYTPEELEEMLEDSGG